MSASAAGYQVLARGAPAKSLNHRAAPPAPIAPSVPLPPIDANRTPTRIGTSESNVSDQIESANSNAFNRASPSVVAGLPPDGVQASCR